MTGEGPLTPERVAAETTRRGRPLAAEDVFSAVSPDGVAVLGFEVDRAEAHDVWRLWLAGHARTGWYPVVVPAGPRRLAADAGLTALFGRGGRDALAAALERDAEELVAEVVSAAVRDVLAQADEDEVDEWLDDLVPERLARRIGDTYPAPVEGDPWGYNHRWSVTRPWLCLVEAAGGHEIPALLPGLPYAPNWWSEPDERPLRPADHVAFLRDWHERFGAEVFFLSGRGAGLLVGRPPLDPVTAARVAVEQFAYCSDVIGDLDVRADGAVRSTVWSFWWD